MIGQSFCKKIFNKNFLKWNLFVSQYFYWSYIQKKRLSSPNEINSFLFPDFTFLRSKPANRLKCHLSQKSKKKIKLKKNCIHKSLRLDLPQLDVCHPGSFKTFIKLGDAFSYPKIFEVKLIFLALGMNIQSQL